MPKHTSSVVASGDISTVYDLALAYFSSRGFAQISGIKPSQITFQRGSVLFADVRVFGKEDLSQFSTKKCNLQVNLSNVASGILIQCAYDIHWAVYGGKSDIENINEEVEGLKNFISISQPQPQQILSKDRICVECKRNIPFDVNICPYCRHDYRKV